MRQVVGTLPEQRGAVYFSVPQTLHSFSVSLTDTVGFNHTTEEEFMSRVGEEPLMTWLPLKKALVETSAAYLAKHGRPMVLVINGVELLANDSPMFLMSLQKFAKACADCSTLRVVFVTSEGNTLPLLSLSSAWSRSLVLEVGDIRDDQAVDYLVRRGVPKDRAADAVATITGGRLILLIQFASTFSGIASNKDYRKPLDVETNTCLINAQIIPQHELFKHLVKHRVIQNDDAAKLLSTEKLRFLLANNILAVHPNNTYTFHSRHVETFFQRQNQDGKK